MISYQRLIMKVLQLGHLHISSIEYEPPGTRSLVGQFTSKTDASTIGHESCIVFLQEALSLISKLLKKSVYSDDQLLLVFEMYNVCLSCFETFSSHEDNTFEFREARTRWKKYEDIQLKGLSLLASRGISFGMTTISESMEDNVELIITIETTIFKCVINGHSPDEEDHCRLVTMLDEIQPYLRFVVNDSTYQFGRRIGNENLHLQFLKFVEDCAIRRRGVVATVAKFLKIEADRF
ncbi:hypothetical protein L1887_23848 [Cichorium endivia]|nr:hypothetical protein L1887_23848 [Cichorium endivia]